MQGRVPRTIDEHIVNMKIPDDWMLRIRYNPFYHYLESRTLDWLDAASE